MAEYAEVNGKWRQVLLKWPFNVLACLLIPFVAGFVSGLFSVEVFGFLGGLAVMILLICSFFPGMWIIWNQMESRWYTVVALLLYGFLAAMTWFVTWFIASSWFYELVTGKPWFD